MITRLFSICPRLSKHSDRIVATTSLRLLLLSVGANYRRVVVDRSKKKISILSRYFWFFRRRRTIQFSQIQAVTYGYEDMSMDSYISFAHDSWDWFTVGLRLIDNTEMLLFNFIGDGTFTNDGPLPDWMYWGDFATDMSGSQEHESRIFAEIVSKIVGVTIVRPAKY